MYHETTNMRVLLSMVLTSNLHRESIELDDRITHAIYSNAEAAFDIDVIVTSETPPHVETDLTFEFHRGTCVLCDKDIAVRLINADRNNRLTAINVTTNKFDLQRVKPAFVPNGAKPIPTLQEALTALDAIPAKAGNFGDGKRKSFTPNEKPDTHPDMQSPSKQRKIKAAIPEGLHVFNKLNKGCYWDAKRAGFWRPTQALMPGERLPFPIVTTCFNYNRNTFIKALEVLQSKVHPRLFRGFAQHRWTGEFNGCAEYRVSGWHWPEGYIAYLKEGVLPSREFYLFVTGKDLKGLPEFKKPE